MLKSSYPGHRFGKTLHDQTPGVIITSGLDGDTHHGGRVEDQSATYSLSSIIICIITIYAHV
jgi:hypothetical protein